MKTNAECWPSSTYGLTRKMVSTKEECAQQARNAGVNLFVSCQNSKFYCYIYTKTQSLTTCATKHNANKCNVHRVTAAAPPVPQTIGKSKYPQLVLEQGLIAIFSFYKNYPNIFTFSCSVRCFMTANLSHMV